MTTPTLAELLLASAGMDAGRPFLVCEGRTWTRGELADAVLRAAGWFARAGFAAGDRVVLMLHNEPAFLIAWFAANLAGAVVVPLDPELRGEELAARLAETDPKALIARPPALAAVAALGDRSPVLKLISAGEAPAGTTAWPELLQGPPAKPLALAREAPAEIIYTAGTTAPAHRVAWRHDFLPVSGIGLSRLLGLHDRDRLMIVLPLFAANAQVSVAMALASGASILLEPGFVAAQFWSRVRRGGATQVSLPGAFLRQLQERRRRKTDRNHGLRLVFSIATPQDLRDVFEQRFGVPVVEGFGSTEMGFVTVSPIEPDRRKRGTVGRPVPWREVAVLDDGTRPAAAGAIGEIAVRSPSGWVRSGDLGVFDKQRFLTFVGRREDMVRRGGEAFSTAIIERALRFHPAIADAAVVALPTVRGDEPVAVVVLRKPVTFDELARFCRERLGDHHPGPVAFKAVTQLPKAPSGRTRKGQLRADPGLFDQLYRVAI